MTDVRPESPMPPDEKMLIALATAANLDISPERLPELSAGYRDLLAQLREIDRLDLHGVVPASSFNPAWKPAS